MPISWRTPSPSSPTLELAPSPSPSRLAWPAGRPWRRPLARRRRRSACRTTPGCGAPARGRTSRRGRWRRRTPPTSPSRGRPGPGRPSSPAPGWRRRSSRRRRRGRRLTRATSRHGPGSPAAGRCALAATGRRAGRSRTASPPRRGGSRGCRRSRSPTTPRRPPACPGCRRRGGRGPGARSSRRPLPGSTRSAPRSTWWARGRAAGSGPTPGCWHRPRPSATATRCTFPAA